jgi:hypothetical protein
LNGFEGFTGRYMRLQAYAPYDSTVYTPISYSFGRLTIEFDVYTGSINGTTFEVGFASGAQIKAAISFTGVDPFTFTPAHFDIFNNGGRVAFFFNPSLSWYHVKIVYNSVTGKSSYWFDNVLVAADYDSSENFLTSFPYSGSCIIIRQVYVGGNNFLYIDNLIVTN